MSKTASYTDHFLIAMPHMLDPNFFQSVIYICEHNESGALGVVINRPTAVKLVEIFEQMNITSENMHFNDQPVLYGGPVHQERGFVIHQPSEEWRSSFKSSEKRAVTTSRDILEAIAHNDGPETALVTLGYSGWGAGQLEQEIMQNTWLVCPADDKILFDTPYEHRWTAAAALLGIQDIYTLSDDAGHA